MRRPKPRIAAFLLAALFALASNPARAAFEDLERGARPLALAGAHAALADDASALFWNPAGMRLLAGGELMSEVARPFGLRNLDQLAFSIVQPTVIGSFGIGVTTLGKANYYTERTLRLAAAREVHERLLLGASIAFLGIDIRPTYGADWEPSLDAGLLYRATDRIRLGAVGRHLNRPSIGDAAVEPGRAGRVGIAFDVEKGILLAADLSFEEDFPARLHIGQEVRVHKLLVLRAGIAASVGNPQPGYSTTPMLYSLGFGAQLSRARLDYAFVDPPARRRSSLRLIPARSAGALQGQGFTGRYDARSADRPESGRCKGAGSLAQRGAGDGATDPRLQN